MLDVTGGTAKIGLKLGVDNGGVLWDNLGMRDAPTHQGRILPKMDRNIEHIADTLRQLGFNVSVCPDGLTIQYEYAGEHKPQDSIFVPTDLAAALASGLRDLKALGVL